MTYKNRLALLILLDSVIVSITIFIAYWIVYPNAQVAYSDTVILVTAIALLLFHHLFAFIYNLYNKVWSYASVGELVAIVKAVTFTLVASGIVQFIINDFSIYRRVLLVTWMIHIILIGGSRFLWRIFRDRYISKPEAKKRTLIVGAGAAGAMIARQLNNGNNDSELWPVAFVDDDPKNRRCKCTVCRSSVR